MTSDALFCPHCGAAYLSAEKQCTFCQHIFAEELDLFDPSDLFHERYEILNQIGSGGFGAVYQARDAQAQQRLVAIKQINLRGLTAQEIIEATDGFNRERQFLSSLTHDHLPRIYDHFMDAEHWYLIMEFIAGQTLETYLQSLTSPSVSLVRALSVDEIVDIGLQLCDVLSYLHRQFQPIIFRDLKPSNVMRTSRGAIYLIDFGIARYFKPGKLKDTIPFGSPGYAAPEQYGKGQTTAQADIYSLGALLYYMLSGLDPAENPFHFAPLRLYGTAGLAELEALILQMVDLDAQQRPSDAQAVAVELLHIRHLRENAEQRIWRPPTSQQPLSAVQVASSLPYWPGSTSQSGQQQAQMSQSQAQQPRTGTSGIGRRLLIKRGWQIGLVVGVGSILLYNAISSSQSSSGTNIKSYNAEAHWPNMELALHKELPNESAGITSVVHSPVKGVFAAADQAGNIFVLDIETCEVCHQWQMSQPVTSLSWSLDAKYLSASTGRSVYIWEIPEIVLDVNAWTISKEPCAVYHDILPATVQTVSWNPVDPMVLAVGDINGNVRVLNLSTAGMWETPIYELVGRPETKRFSGTPQSVVVNWVGELLYSLVDNSSINVWDLHNQQNEVTTYTILGLDENVQEVLLLIKSDRLAVLTTNGQISFLDKNYNAYLLLNSDSIINALAQSDDGLYIFGAVSGRIYIWSVALPHEAPQSFAPQETMLSIDYINYYGEKTVITGTINGVVQIWRDRSSAHISGG